jgi:hypothetical protein
MLKEYNVLSVHPEDAKNGPLQKTRVTALTLNKTVLSVSTITVWPRRRCDIVQPFLNTVSWVSLISLLLGFQPCSGSLAALMPHSFQALSRVRALNHQSV